MNDCVAGTTAGTSRAFVPLQPGVHCAAGVTQVYDRVVFFCTISTDINSDIPEGVRERGRCDNMVEKVRLSKQQQGKKTRKNTHLLPVSSFHSSTDTEALSDWWHQSWQYQVNTVVSLVSDSAVSNIYSAESKLAIATCLSRGNTWLEKQRFYFVWCVTNCFIWQFFENYFAATVTGQVKYQKNRYCWVPLSISRYRYLYQYSFKSERYSTLLMTSHAHKVATLQSQKSHTLKHALGFHLFYTKVKNKVRGRIFIS